MGLYQTMSTPFRATGLGRVVPSHWKRRIRQTLSRRAPEKYFEVPIEVEELIWSELADDLARLRTIVGPEFDLWGRA